MQTNIDINVPSTPVAAQQDKSVYPTEAQQQAKAAISDTHQRQMRGQALQTAAETRDNNDPSELVRRAGLFYAFLAGEKVEDELPGPVTIERIARVCHEANAAYCRALGDMSQPAWEEAPDWQRLSAINGVRFIITNPDVSANAAHESWLEEKRAAGWTYGEVKDPVKKTHPCFLPYYQLPPEQRAKDHIFGAIVRAVTAP